MSKNLDVIYPSFSVYFITDYGRHTTTHSLIVSDGNIMNIFSPHLEYSLFKPIVLIKTVPYIPPNSKMGLLIIFSSRFMGKTVTSMNYKISII